MTKKTKLSDKEFNNIIYKIAKPVFKNILKRMNREFIEKEEYKNIDMNELMNVIVGLITNLNTNIVFWAKEFYKMKTNNEINTNKLVVAIIKILNEQLQTVVH